MKFSFSSVDRFIRMILSAAFDYAARSFNRSKDQRTNWLDTDAVPLIAHILDPFYSLFSVLYFSFSCSLSLSLYLSVSPLCACVHRGAWTNAVQQLRAALHQLHQRKTAAILQPSHVRARAGRVRARRYHVDLHRFRHGFGADDQSDREGKTTGPRGTRTRYSGSPSCDPVMQQFALEFGLPVELAAILPMLCASSQMLCYYSPVCILN